MTKHLALLALAGALSGCFLTYDPEAVEPAQQGTGLAIGAACGGAGQCASGYCVDGVCCDQACAGQCEACDLSGSEGSCLAVTGAPHGARAACASDTSICGGTCNGLLTTACDYPTMLCRAHSCTGSTETYAAFCASGSCPAPSTQGCEPYVCGGVSCKPSCGADTDCTTGNFCLVTTCVAKRAAGDVCTAANQCASGFCSPDGRCCDAACTGSCETCDGVNTVGGAPAGTCAPIQAGSRPAAGHADCAGDVAGLCAGSCDGVTTAACSYPTPTCVAASCSAGTQVEATTCSAGSCPMPTTTPCAPYVCGATACLTSCVTSADCTVTNYCNASSQCVPKVAQGAPCTGSPADQCASGQCADGVCCDVACGGCKACNLAGSVGTCTNVLAGQDPHAACSLASCQTTCNGSGACATAPFGQYCASNSCVDLAPDAYGRPTDARATVAWCGGATQTCPVPSNPNQSCNGFSCQGSQCGLTCADHSDCVSGARCVAGRCQFCEIGADCDATRSMCNGGYCDCPADPGGCSLGCSGSLDCTLAGLGSACGGSGDCACTPGDGACNGRGPRCSGASGACSCGPTAGNLCRVGELCSDASLGGVCKIAPGFPCTGVALPTDCASGACSGGTCTRLGPGRPCTRGADCLNGTCLSTWVCN